MRVQMKLKGLKRTMLAIMLGVVMIITVVLILCSNRNYIDSEIDNKYKTEILDLFGVKLPGRGIVFEYKFDESNEFVEIHLNEEDYESIIKQLDEIANKDEYEGDLEKYMEDDDIKKEYWVSGKTTGCYYMPMHNIYVSKIQDDVFRVIFEMDGI